jgi:RsmE family RNA methyltransferase
MNILLFFPSDRSDKGRSNFFLPLFDDRARHLLKILGVKKGDVVRAGIADGPRGKASVDEIQEDGIVLSFVPDSGEQEESAGIGPFLLDLVVGQVRPICAKRILREAAMLGVSSISVVGTDLGERSYREAKLWSSGEAERYLIDGVVQAAATAIPALRLFESLDHYLSDAIFSPEYLRITLDNVAPSNPLFEFAGKLPAVLAVGSERGWSDRERKLFSKAGWSFAGLGGRILRTETASTAALAILLATDEGLFSSRCR